MKLSTAKKKANAAFSLYIRTKYSTEGFCECFTCNKIMSIKTSQCGHGISGRSNGILFLEEVCRPQCMGCNVMQSGRYDVFVPKLIELYGLDGYKEFMTLKNSPKKYKVQDYLDIESEYKEMLNELP